MERWRAVLITLVCVLISRISGEEVEMKVRQGENVILYCDCEEKIRTNIFWLKNSTNKDQPPLIISKTNLIQAAFSHLALVWNHSNQTQDLLVKNFTESDLGLYYCAVQKIKLIKDKTGADVRADVYHYGNRTTRLSFLDSTCTDPTQTPSTPPVSDCGVCWKLLVSVCPVCVLLSSTCAYFICRNRDKGEKKNNEEERENKEDQKRTKSNEGGGDDVIYTPVNITSREQKRVKKNRVQRSDISTYSEVVYDLM